MDRQLTERMVGAACLLAVLVLVVPAILDGNPDPGATITHPSVDESQDVQTHTILLDRAERSPPLPSGGQVSASPEMSLPAVQKPAAEPAAKPESAPGPTAESHPEPQPVLAPEARAEPPAQAEPVAEVRADPVPGKSVASGAAVATGSGGDWTVQLGSFSRRDNADRLAGALRAKGFTVSVVGGGGASGTLFRVRAGPEADRAAAEALAARLAVAGFSGGHIGRQ